MNSDSYGCWCIYCIRRDVNHLLRMAELTGYFYRKPETKNSTREDDEQDS